MPRRERQPRDVLSRQELDLFEAVMPSERDKLIIRIFADCGLRLNELTSSTPTTSSRCTESTIFESSASATAPETSRFPSNYSIAWNDTSPNGRRTASPKRSSSRRGGRGSAISQCS